jgi:hypothetical protein
MDFLRKDLVRTFAYTTMNEYRGMERQVVVNGRTYVKLGQAQAVTLVGNLYKCWDPIVESYKYMLMVGVAKQHPCDLKITKQEGYAVANEHAYVSPAIVMEVDKDFNKEKFNLLAMCYIEMMHLNFVKTPKEIASEKNPEME